MRSTERVHWYTYLSDELARLCTRLLLHNHESRQAPHRTPLQVPLSLRAVKLILSKTPQSRQAPTQDPRKASAATHNSRQASTQKPLHAHSNPRTTPYQRSRPQRNGRSPARQPKSPTHRLEMQLNGCCRRCCTLPSPWMEIHHSLVSKNIYHRGQKKAN